MIDDMAVYGRGYYPALLLNRTDVSKIKLEFFSDWITTTFLANPKGFLVYFERKIKVFRFYFDYKQTALILILFNAK
jgi:hypothetical protein